MATLTECKCEGYTYVTYEDYCVCVDEILAENKTLNPAQKSKFRGILDFLTLFKQKIALQLRLMKVSFKDLITAMMHKDFYAMLHMLKFNLTLLLKALGSVQRLIAQGLLKILSVIASRENMILFRAKLIKIDDFIKKYPILKYLTGAALCGLLIWMWTNMTFIGDFDFDFDLTVAFQALLGTYTLHHLLGTDEGLLFTMLFFTGIATPLNFNWILATPVLIPIMMLYTINKNKPWAIATKRWVKTHAQKVSTSQYKYRKIAYYDPKTAK